MRVCEICEREYVFSNIGPGGHNRKSCYDCIPDGMSRDDRNKLRSSLLSRKFTIYKIERGCTLCGYSKCGNALEYHHLNPEEKDRNPGDSLSISWEACIKEVEKCILLCSNCHREVHAGISVI